MPPNLKKIDDMAIYFWRQQLPNRAKVTANSLSAQLPANSLSVNLAVLYNLEDGQIRDCHIVDFLQVRYSFACAPWLRRQIDLRHPIREHLQTKKHQSP